MKKAVFALGAALGSLSLGYATAAPLVATSGIQSVLPDLNCVDCQLRARMLDGLSPLVGATSGNLELASSIASVLNYPSIAQRPSSAIQFPMIDTSGVTWNGQGDLPGAFQAPWSFGTTGFDPRFRTSYWNEENGPLNQAYAPWNIGLSNEFAARLYDLGMLYVGLPYEAPRPPVFLNEKAAATRAN